MAAENVVKNIEKKIFFSQKILYNGMLFYPPKKIRLFFKEIFNFTFTASTCINIYHLII